MEAFKEHYHHLLELIEVIKVTDIFTDHLKRHRRFDQALLNRTIKQDKVLVNNLATIESRKLYKMSREVGCELHRLKSLIRLDFAEPNILFGKIKAEHKIEDLLIDFFLERFPTMHIVIESNKGCFSKAKELLFTKHNTSLNQTIQIIKDNINKNGSFKNAFDYDYLADFRDEYWTEFYKNQAIDMRKNKKYFSKMIPKKYREMEKLDEERVAFADSENLNRYF